MSVPTSIAYQLGQMRKQAVSGDGPGGFGARPAHGGYPGVVTATRPRSTSPALSGRLGRLLKARWALPAALATAAVGAGTGVRMATAGPAPSPQPQSGGVSPLWFLPVPAAAVMLSHYLKDRDEEQEKAL